MTTTLRPVGPLRQEAGGARSRAYRICDNSRPVGTIEIATLPEVGSEVGSVRSLRIDPADRRRGRGTIAALAAEEVLRGWGCTQVQISVPPEAVGAARLAAALGYAERSRNMAKTLGEHPPALPDGVVARPMTGPEFDAWQSADLLSYARSWAERGLSAEAARAKAEADHAAGLPDGLATPGVFLEVVEHEGAVVGHLYLGEREIAPGERGAYVYDVEVAEGRRGRGHGRALMLLAERRAREAGARLLGLHVFAGNDPALGLYTSLGYRTVFVNSAKPLI